MASMLRVPSTHLSNSLEGPVLPRLPTGGHQGFIRSGVPVLKTSIRSDTMSYAPFPSSHSKDTHHATEPQSNSSMTWPMPSKATPPSQPANPGQTQAKTTGKRKLSDYYRTPIRRQQCRANQARYRNRQREYQQQLEDSVGQLRQEVDNFKLKYRDLSSRERSSQSPWSVVAEVFRLLESSFRSPWRVVNAQEMKNHKETRQILAVLERAFTHDAAMGHLQGVDSVIEQLRRYSQYFANPYLQLLRVESAAPGVMAARAKLSVTVSESSLQHVFVSDDDSKRDQLREQLLGQRLEIDCTMNFLFDEESCRVVRLEVTFDLVVALRRVLSSLGDVLAVLEHALITSESIIGPSEAVQAA
ncbi:unnamed protein product [Phytophthora lilii]|uniref:Unnamed protein product n=1 Tax=Phytophthora lilii TaxID=2077276 RepID=A0A9W6UFD5_9STRA|nr:unnamed protein product [Phytophthora lilii]